MCCQVVRHPVQGAVLYPCLIAIAVAAFICIENAIWRVGDSYPTVLTQDRYVDDEMLFNSSVVSDICNLPLTAPELRRKRNGLFLRCGTPGIEGMYRILLYQAK